VEFFFETVVLQITLRFVACNKLEVLGRKCSDVGVNITSQCVNKILGHWPSSWQLKSGISNFKFVVTANGTRVLLFELMYSNVITALPVKRPEFKRQSVNLKPLSNGVAKLRNSTVQYLCPSLYQTFRPQRTTYLEMFVDNSKNTQIYLFHERLQINCNNGIFTTIYVSLSVRLSLFTNKTTRLTTKGFPVNVPFEELPRKFCNH